MADYFETYGRNIIKDENPVYYMDGNRIKSYDTGETVFEMYGNRIYGDGGGTGGGFSFDPEFIGSITNSTTGSTAYDVFENLFDYDFIVITNEAMDEFASVTYLRPICYIIPTPEPISKSFDELACVSKTASGTLYDNGKIRVDIHPDGTVYYYRSVHTPTSIYIYGVHKKGTTPIKKGLIGRIVTNVNKVDGSNQEYVIDNNLITTGSFIDVVNDTIIRVNKGGKYKILCNVENVGGISTNNSSGEIQITKDGIETITQQFTSYKSNEPNEFIIEVECNDGLAIAVENDSRGWCTVASMLIIEV